MKDNLASKTVEIHQNEQGDEPFVRWLESLDLSTQLKVRKRLRRIEEVGHYGDYASVGKGVLELRFFFGSGYRIYFGEVDNFIVLLLCAGDKKHKRKI